MITDTLIYSIAALSGTMVLAATALRGWQGWLALKTRELDHHRPELEGGSPSGMARIEISDLKERIRKLEAIAAGVDL